MALIDDIIKKAGQVGTQPPVPVAQSPVATEVEPQPVVAPPVTAPVPEPPAAQPNRFGYDEATVEYLSQNGYTPDVLERIATFDPASYGSVMEQVYANTRPAPVEPDERQLQNARTVSGIADSLGMIGQMISVGSGAQLPVRTFEQGAMARTNAEERRLRDLYKAERAQYDQGRYDARLRDLLNAISQNKGEKDALGRVVAAKRKADQDQVQFDAAQALRREQDATRQKNEDRDYEIAKGGLDLRRTTEARMARQAAIRSGSSGSKGKELNITVRANSNDPYAQVDSAGRAYREFPLTESQRDGYYRDALSDSGFRQRHPDLFPAVDPVSGTTKEISHTAQEMANIAAVYFQEKYDAQPWEREKPESSQATWRPATLNRAPVASDEWDQYVEN